MNDPLTRSPIVSLIFFLARSPYYDNTAEGLHRTNYKDQVNQREGFKLSDPKKINQIYIMNYFFILGDVLIMFLILLSFISDEFERLEDNIVTLIWQISLLLSCVTSIIIRYNIQGQIKDKYIRMKAAIAENYHHLVQIVMMIFGIWPQIQQEHNNDKHLLGCLKFIEVFLFIRLLRFILRFSCGFILMIAACTQWIFRKKVKKGLIRRELDSQPEISLQDMADYDGLPPFRKKLRDEESIQTPEFSIDENLLTEEQKSQNSLKKQKRRGTIQSQASIYSQPKSQKHKPLKDLHNENVQLFLSQGQLQV
ncbi:UNKNOWN [Stylonychia lemnae]|uniref:Transmembrane protein n=1 Tax=Stylonychia lemnae TaxID=5949 RepID=A0A078A6J5_STYLE|nr:UNKNOWN [Stylonychia lemnae]|eukprot:CDW76354.1 UNKNOWN [Stylonychia lemnae]